MKTFITLTAALVLSGLVLESQAQEKDKTEMCANIHSLAGTIMGLRQTGVPMPDVIDVFSSSELGRMIVIRAYEEPRYRTEDHQERSKSEFADDWYLDCLRAE